MDPAEIALLDRRFGALADETRRGIWRTLGARAGATTAELTAAFPRLTRWAVMKHLAVMREAGLIQTLPQGRSRHHYRDERALEPIREWLVDG